MILTSLGFGCTWLHCESKCEWILAPCVKLSRNTFVTEISRINIDINLVVTFDCVKESECC